VPELTFRLLGYGGLGAVAVAHLLSEGRIALWLLLAFTVSWPVAWWSVARRHPAVFTPHSPIGRGAHAVECLLVVGAVMASGIDPWMVAATGLLALTGVTALGGLALLGPSALAVGLVVFVFSQGSAIRASMDPAIIAGGMLVSTFLLGLSLLCFQRVVRLNDRRRLARSETAVLRHRNARMARYLPGGLVPLLGEPSKSPAETFVTVAFVDVVGFVELVASRPMAELVDVINDFIGTIAELTESRGGVLSKFLGDGALIYFSAALEEDRWESAVRCARLCLDFSERLDLLAGHWRRRGLTVDLTARAGMASGYCALGDWGSGDRLDYTLIGTPVNLASRLQAAAPESGVLLAGAAAALVCEDADLAARLGPARTIPVRGLGECMVHELTASANVRANSISTPRVHGKDLSEGL
jgi:class 3 adenylate cyclase